MDFSLNEEQLMVQQAARILPKTNCCRVLSKGMKRNFSCRADQENGRIGFYGNDGGSQIWRSGLDTISYVLAMEEISKVDASASVVMSVNNSLVCWGLQEFGTEEQKQQWLPLLASARFTALFV